MLFIDDKRADQTCFLGSVIRLEDCSFVFCFEDDLRADKVGTLISLVEMGFVLLGDGNAVLRSVAGLACHFTGRHFEIAADDAINAKLIAGFFKRLCVVEVGGRCRREGVFNKTVEGLYAKLGFNLVVSHFVFSFELVSITSNPHI